MSPATNGVYKFSNVTLYEGTLVNFKYTVDSTDVDQRFIIPNVNADTTTLKVTVQNSISDTTTKCLYISNRIKNFKQYIKGIFFIKKQIQVNLKFTLVMMY